MALAGTKMAAVTALDMQIQARGIPIRGVGGPPWTVDYEDSATQAQIDEGEALAAAFDGKDRIYRTLADILANVSALSKAQKDAIAADLEAGSPSKMLRGSGINVPSLFALHFSLNSAGVPPADKTMCRDYITTLYVQDNPYYLDQPPFSAGIAVYGLAPVE